VDLDAIDQPVACNVGSSKRCGRRRKLGRVDPSVRNVVRQRNGNATAAGPDIEQAIARDRPAPGLKSALNQLGQRRAGNQHRPRDFETQAGKPGFAQQVGERHALGDSFGCDTRGFVGQRRLRQTLKGGPIPVQQRGDEPVGFVGRIVRAVAVEERMPCQEVFENGQPRGIVFRRTERSLESLIDHGARMIL
jgi:hypothetical protein